MDSYNHTGYAQVLEETIVDNLTPSTNTITYTIGDDVITQSNYQGPNPGDFTNDHLLYDGHGSTRQLTSDPDPGSANAITINEAYSYDAYGVMLGGNPGTPQNPGSPTTNLLYAGEQFDTDMQQYYLRARYYDQNTGRFNRMDSFGGNNLDPQSLHKYIYAHGNPVNGNDPSGSFFIGGYLGVFAISQIMCSQVPLVGGTRNQSKLKFDAWYNRQTNGWWEVLPKCPCKITVKDGKPSYAGKDKKKWWPPKEPHEYEERLHPEIAFSMRSVVSWEPHTNQCTYDQYGKLYTGFPQAGTVDFWAPVTLPHLREDVYPLHWAVHVDTRIRMRVEEGPKTPQLKDSYVYMKKYYEKRRLWDKDCPTNELTK